MEAIGYIGRCIFAVLITWVTIRIIGKKSISQITSYDFVAMMLISTVAAEPLVYKVSSKSFVGSITIALLTVGIGLLSLNKKYYNLDSKPDILVVNGKVDREALKRNKMNRLSCFRCLEARGMSKYLMSNSPSWNLTAAFLSYQNLKAVPSPPRI